jgi:hypothetical protein
LPCTAATSGLLALPPAAFADAGIWINAGSQAKLAVAFLVRIEAAHGSSWHRCSRQGADITAIVLQDFSDVACSFSVPRASFEH